jgi:anti-sigma factor (TIGR02949 family)
MTRMTCEQAMRQFFAYLDRALSGESLEALESHLEGCLECCDRLKFSRQLDFFVRDSVRKAPATAGIEERIRRKLAEAPTSHEGS